MRGWRLKPVPGKGDECIHRGYYCPSLIKDIVIGNCKCGGIIKRRTAKSERDLSYEYGFCDDQLIFVRQIFSERVREFEYIFEYDTDGFLSSYKIIKFEEGVEKEGFYCKDHAWKVYEKRKV